MLQASDHLGGSTLDLLQQVHFYLMLGGPKMDATLQVGSHESGVEVENHIPQPSGHTSCDVAQDMVGLYCSYFQKSL